MGFLDDLVRGAQEQADRMFAQPAQKKKTSVRPGPIPMGAPQGPRLQGPVQQAPAYVQRAPQRLTVVGGPAFQPAPQRPAPVDIAAFARTLASGMQQSAGNVADVALMGGSMVENAAIDINPFTSEAQKNKIRQQQFKNTEKLRDFVKQQKTVTGESFNRYQDFQPTGNFAQDAATVAGRGLQTGLDATMLVNPTRAGLAGLTGKQAAKQVAKTAGKEAALFGGGTGLAVTADVYGQTGDLNLAMQEGAKAAALAGAAQAGLNVGGYAVGRGARGVANQTKQAVELHNSMTPAQRQRGSIQLPGENITDQKLSRFANRTVQSSDEVSTPLKKLVKDEQASYTTTTNEGRLAEAQNFLKNKTDDDAMVAIQRELSSGNVMKTNGQSVVNAIELAKRLDAKGDETSLFKATEIYHELSGYLSKRGQEVQAASLLANRTPEGAFYGAVRDLDKAGIKVTPEIQATMKALTENIRNAADPDAANFARHELAKYVSGLVPAGTASKVINFWRAGLLTAPTTTGGNILGNSGEAFVRKGFVNPVATAADVAMSAFTGKRSMALNGGFAKGAKEGGSKLGRFMKTGYDERNALSKYDAKELNYGTDGVGKLIGGYVNGTYRLMSVADQPFWYGARQEALQSLAKVEAINKGIKGDARQQFIADFVKNPPKAAMERATKEAKYGTFQNETTLGTVAGGLKNAARQRSDIAGAAADFFIPFTQVPSSIATRVVQRTPVGTAVEAVKQFIKVKKGGQFDQRAMSQAIAEGSFGPAVFAAGYALANSGQLTFGFPEDTKERELWEAEGKQPYSVRIGDRWYSLNYLQPFGTLLSVGGEAANAVKEGASATETISRGVATAGQAVMNQSFLKGISGVLDAIDNPKQYAENYVANTAGSVVPNVIRSGARAADPMQRKQEGPAGGIIGAIPGVRQTLPEKQDMFGQGIEAKDNFLNQYLNPLRPSKVRGEDDETFKELRRLKEVDEGILPTAADKRAFGKLGDISSDQVRELNKQAGQALKTEYDRIIASPEYQALNDASKAKTLSNINKDVFGAVKHRYGIEIGKSMDVRKLTRDQRAYLEGTPNSFISEVKEDSDGTTVSTASATVNSKLASTHKDVLKKYASLDETKRKEWFNKENDAEFKYVAAKYENDKAEGKISDIQDIKRKKELAKEEVGSKFSKETRDLYQLGKADLYNYVVNSPKGEKLAKELLAYDQALVAAGLNPYNNALKFKNGLAPAKGGKKSGGKARTAKAKKGTKGGKQAAPKMDSGNATAIRLAALGQKKSGGSTGFKKQLNVAGNIRKPGLAAYKKAAKTTVNVRRTA